MFPPIRTGAALLLAILLPLTLTSCDETSGPKADLSIEVTGGNGPFIGSLAGATPPAGYEVHEYFASGTATAYEAPNGFTDDGLFDFHPSTTAEYKTRILVRRPSDPSTASGTVVVEWLNVSGGVDADAEYGSLVEEIVRQGHTWVGVSAQLVGVEGGPVLIEIAGGGNFAGKGLKLIDPARYSTLSHPGDGYSFDIFTQVARALRSGGEPLGGVRPRLIIAAGESQSAMALTTYYDGVQPLTHAFDAFFIHSRAGVAIPLVAPGESADLGSAIFNQEHPIFRGDLRAPVMDVQAEGDTVGLLNSNVARQADSARYRLWEVAGTSHADLHLLGAAASAIDCHGAINNGPMHVVTKAAFRALVTWALGGEAPPVAARLTIDPNPGSTPFVSRDADGIALGGLRTAPVDVPVDALTGLASANGGLACLLFGSTTPLSDTRIAELYTSRMDYQTRFDASVDASIAAGYVLEDDRVALEAYAQPLRVNP